MFILSAILLVLASLYLLKYAHHFVRNYINAVRTGLPIITVPIDQNSVLWMVTSIPLRPWMETNLPTRIWDRVKCTIYGWEHHEKLRPFHSIANRVNKDDVSREPSFMLSTCGKLELWTSSPALTQQILLQPKDFQQLDVSEWFMGIFGQNVLVVNGDTWSQHRKIVATAVTERISPVIWAESIKHTRGVVNEICEPSQDSGETRRFFDMAKTVAINVLSKAGLGVEKDWSSTRQNEHSSGNSEISYMDAVKLINDSLTGPLILPTKALLNWPSFLPGYMNLRRLGSAKVLFPLRTKEMLAEERERLGDASNSSEKSKNTFISMLIAASEGSSDSSNEKKSEASVKRPVSLTNDELVGNLWIFTAAGYDTTANTLAFACTLLMRYPKWQKWVSEEVDNLLKERPGSNSEDVLSDYQAIFPKCVRLLAVMFETLRLFPPVIHISKMTKKPETLVTEGGRKFVLPAETTTYVDCVALHLDPRVWRDLNPSPDDNTDDWEDDIPGHYAATPDDIELGGGKLGDEWRFRPTRWVNPTPDPKEQKPTSSLFQPPRCSFIPWSAGPRVCPGQRMAQVEFVAILMTILSEYRMEAVAYNNESREALNERLDLIMQKSISKLTLEMDVYDKGEDQDDEPESRDGNGKHTKGLKVRLVKRKSSPSG